VLIPHEIFLDRKKPSLRCRRHPRRTWARRSCRSRQHFSGWQELGNDCAAPA